MQIDVGAGANATQLDWNWSDGTPWTVAGGDSNGVGHFNARSNTGRIVANMLATTCSGAGCPNGYAYCPHKLRPPKEKAATCHRFMHAPRPKDRGQVRRT